MVRLKIGLFNKLDIFIRSFHSKNFPSFHSKDFGNFLQIEDFATSVLLPIPVREKRASEEHGDHNGPPCTYCSQIGSHWVNPDNFSFFRKSLNVL